MLTYEIFHHILHNTSHTVVPNSYVCLNKSEGEIVQKQTCVHAWSVALLFLMAHEEGILYKEDFGITLKDLDETFELTSYFLSSTGPTHIDKLLFNSLNLHANQGK